MRFHGARLNADERGWSEDRKRSTDRCLKDVLSRNLIECARVVASRDAQQSEHGNEAGDRAGDDIIRPGALSRIGYRWRSGGTVSTGCAPSRAHRAAPKPCDDGNPRRLPHLSYRLWCFGVRSEAIHLGFGQLRNHCRACCRRMVVVGLWVS